MASPEEQQYDERQLVRYLLGTLTREETDRLDELSIVDDEFAARLSAAENELVDAYVRKELSPGDLEKFTASYLSSPRRRQKVDFSQALLAFETSGKTRATEAAPAPEIKAPPATARPRRTMYPGWFPRLAFGGLALALLIGLVYFFQQNLRLRQEIDKAQTRVASLLQNQDRLQQQIAQQRSDNSEAQRQLDQVQGQPSLGQLKTVSLLLMPPTRGTGRPPSITVPHDTDLATFILTLEADDFPVYRAGLKDPTSDRAIWESQNLESSGPTGKKMVAISLPASLLKQQNYILELSGIRAKGQPENIAAYSFHVVLK